jgi:tetratricopeptide (TPR) repeat protein
MHIHMKKLLPWIIVLGIFAITVGVSALYSARNDEDNVIAIGERPTVPQTLTGQKITAGETAIAAEESAEKQAEQSIQLAQVYLQLVRETTDASYYARIETLLAIAEQQTVFVADVAATRSAVAAGKHDFKTAETEAQKAIALRPQSAYSYGVLADAQIELGKYDEAEQTLQTMVDLRPDFSSFTRIAYLRELHGDIPGAKAALEQAIQGGSTYAENLAWAVNEIGNLELRTSTEAAVRRYEQALTYEPHFAPAMAGIGVAAFVDGNMAKATEYLQKAFTEQPRAEFAIALGDLYHINGDTDSAEIQYTLAEAAYRQSEAAGTSVSLELAHFLLTHDRNLEQAFVLAQSAYEQRPSIFGADVYALALYKQDKLDEAQAMTDAALRLGEHDAAIVYHSGLIAEKKGETDKAQHYFETVPQLSNYFGILETTRFNERK